MPPKKGSKKAEESLREEKVIHPGLNDASSNAPKNPHDATVRTSNPQVHEAPRSSQLVSQLMKMQKSDIYESEGDSDDELPKTHDERLNRLEEQHDLIVSEVNRIKNLQKHIAFTLFKIIMDAT